MLTQGWWNGHDFLKAIRCLWWWRRRCDYDDVKGDKVVVMIMLKLMELILASKVMKLLLYFLWFWRWWDDYGHVEGDGCDDVERDSDYDAARCCKWCKGRRSTWEKLTVKMLKLSTCVLWHHIVRNIVPVSGTCRCPAWSEYLGYRELTCVIWNAIPIGSGPKQKQVISQQIPVVSCVRHGMCLSCSRTVLAKRNATGWLLSSILSTAYVPLKATDRHCFGAKLCGFASALSKVALSVYWMGSRVDIWRIGAQFSSSSVLLHSVHISSGSDSCLLSSRYSRHRPCS